jgi:uncharacterized protein YneF (UPF0154 family)
MILVACFVSSKQATNIIKTIHQYHQNNPPISSKQATNIIKTSHQYHQNNPPISSKQATNIIKTSHQYHQKLVDCFDNIGGLF